MFFISLIVPLQTVKVTFVALSRDLQCHPCSYWAWLMASGWLHMCCPVACDPKVTWCLLMFIHPSQEIHETTEIPEWLNLEQVQVAEIHGPLAWRLDVSPDTSQWICLMFNIVPPIRSDQWLAEETRRNMKSPLPCISMFFCLEIFYTQSFTIGLKRQQSIGVQHSPNGFGAWNPGRSMWISLWKQPRPGLELPGCTVDGFFSKSCKLTSWGW